MRVNKVIERVNTVAAVGGLIALLGVGGYWLFNGGDEPSNGSITGTEILQEAATRPAPAVESTTAKEVEDSLNLVRTDQPPNSSGLERLPAWILDPWMVCSAPVRVPRFEIGKRPAVCLRPVT